MLLLLMLLPPLLLVLCPLPLVNPPTFMVSLQTLLLSSWNVPTHLLTTLSPLVKLAALMTGLCGNVHSRRSLHQSEP